jgi:alkylation response protein AidB-like acyl-CoA dehydrogenase
MGFDLGLTATQEEMRERLHALAWGELRARAADAERDGADLTVLAADLRSAGLDPARIAGGDVPEIHTLLVALDELAYGDPGLAWAAAGPLQLALIVGSCAGEELRGEIAAALSTDPAATTSFLAYEDFGRSPSEYETTASHTGNGWAVSGRKTSVAHPAAADVSGLLARNGSGDLTAFAWDGDRAGLRLERDDRAVGKLALTAVPTGPVTIERLELRDAERIDGGIELHRTAAQARLLLAAVLVGTARASIEFCAGHALERTTWGRPIAEYQGVSFPIIEHSTRIDEARLLLWDTGTRVSESDEVAEIERLTSRAIARASTLALTATRDGVQLIGVRAITRDLPSERWYRSAAVLAAIDFDPLQTPFGLS